MATENKINIDIALDSFGISAFLFIAPSMVVFFWTTVFSSAFCITDMIFPYSTGVKYSDYPMTSLFLVTTIKVF